MKCLAASILALLMTGCAVIHKSPVKLVPIPAIMARDLAPTNELEAPLPSRPVFARTLTRILSLSEGPTLSIYYTNLFDVCLVTLVTTPPITNGVDVAAGGSGLISIANYTGPGVAIVAHGLLSDTNVLYVEISHDLTNWVAWPHAGFQLTMMATNTLSCFPLDTNNPATFFRGRVGITTY
jgi:hypothetical protein